MSDTPPDDGRPSYPWLPVHVASCGCGEYVQGLTGKETKRMKWYCSIGHMLDD